MNGKLTLSLSAKTFFDAQAPIQRDLLKPFLSRNWALGELGPLWPKQLPNFCPLWLLRSRKIYSMVLVDLQKPYPTDNLKLHAAW